MLSRITFTRAVGTLGAITAGLATTTLVLALSATPNVPGVVRVSPPARAAVVDEELSGPALAEYRAFYAEQIASEAALEHWALPAEAAAERAAPSRVADAELLASEAALGRWTTTAPHVPAAAPAELPIPATAGVQSR